VHDIDQQAHTGSLRCAVRIADAPTFASEGDKKRLW
jgi:hypothetical protein